MKQTKIILPDDVETMGAAIRHLRTERRMTLRELARRVGVSAPFLSDLEHDRRKTAKIPEIARELGVDAEVLERLDGRLPTDLKLWIERNPEMVRLLREIRASGRDPRKLRIR